MNSGVYDTNLVSAIIQIMIAFADLETGQSPVRLGNHVLQVANGRFIFNITGPTYTTMAIEQSTNL